MCAHCKFSKHVGILTWGIHTLTVKTNEHGEGKTAKRKVTSKDSPVSLTLDVGSFGKCQ